MRILRIISSTLILLCFVLLGCKYEFPTRSNKSEPIPKNRAVYDNFYVIGGSLTAGVMDGALYKSGQMSSYPNLFGYRLDSLLDQENYGIPAIKSENGYNLDISESGNIKGKFKLSFRNANTDYPARITIQGERIEKFRGSIDTVSNLSIPHLRSYQIFDNDSLRDNLFSTRFVNQMSNHSILDYVLSKNPSLVLLSLGADDIMPYIINGASGRIKPPANDIQPNDATPLALFKKSIENAVNQILDSTNADIILPTIIDPLDFFYFNTLSWHFESGAIGSEKITQLQKHYRDFNFYVQEYNFSHSGNDRRPQIIFDTYPGLSNRAKTFVDDLLPYAETTDGTVIPKYRQMERDDKMLYNAEKVQHTSLVSENKDFATFNPAPDKMVLSKEEIDLIEKLLDSYNEIIHTVAQHSNRIYLLDLNSLIKEIQTGEKTFRGIKYNTGFDQNTIISADGYSLNKKGQALLANHFLKLLNSKYNSKFTPFDVNNFEGNTTTLGF